MNLEQFNKVLGAAAGEFQETGLDSNQYFMWSILKMNTMYSLPINVVPTLDDLGEAASARVMGFLKTMQKEMDEGREVLALVTVYEWLKAGHAIGAEQINALVERVQISADRRALIVPILNKIAADTELARRESLVALADWLADINVYVRSEALKFGLPQEAALNVIMGSNFTKLGTDGEPIKDENGKVQKGPNFIAPEEALHALLFGSEDLIEEFNERQIQMNQMNLVAGPTLFDPMAQIHAAQASVDEVDEEAEEEEAEADAVEEVYEVHDEIPEGGESDGRSLNEVRKSGMFDE
jgi:hypothetical protein